MNKDDMVEALRKCISAPNGGVGIINSTTKLQAALKDCLPGNNNIRERKALLDALSIDEWHLLVDVHGSSKSEHDRAVQVIIPQLQDFLGWTAERAVLVVECYTTALGWNDITIASPSITKPQPQPATNTIVLDDETRDLLDFVKQLKQSSGGQLQPPQNTIIQPPVPKSAASPVIGSTIEFGAYTWRVLDVQNGRALIIAKDVTHVSKKYNETYTAVTWETCTLRKWLNEDFYRSFSTQEQSRILLTTNANEDNPWYGTKGGNRTSDKVFLLSLSEIVKYFGDSGDLSNKRRKSYTGNSESNGYYLHDQYNSTRIANYNDSPAWWWLRSPGIDSYGAAYVNNDGVVGVHGDNVNSESGSGGVRPALWLNL